jgi:hypothetical protein
MPEPFRSLSGESEQVRNYFFDLGKGRIFAVKVPADETIGAELWRQMNAFRRGNRHAALLPLPGNQAKDGVLIYQDGQWIAKVLRRLKLVSEGGPSILRSVVSGLAGFSRLYLMHLPESGQNVLVKFDRPDRLRAEWKSIETLRSAGDTPAQLQFPFVKNVPSDGIMVFPVFQGRTLSGEVSQLNEFLIRQLMTNFKNVELVLDLMESFLRHLYLGGAGRYEAMLWQDFNQELTTRAVEIRQMLSKAGLIPNPLAERFTLPPFSTPGTFSNPLHRLEAHLGEQTGRLLKARTHGDLQSTNILVALGPYERPDELAIIDIEKLAGNQPVVEDVVRIEADFWRSVFTAIASSHFQGRSEEELLSSTVAAFVLAVDRLDGRPLRAPITDPEVERLAGTAGRFIFEARRRIWGLLSEGPEPYWPISYFRALRFYYLKALLRPLVTGIPLRLRIVLVAAALAEETIREMEGGMYPGGRNFPGEWPESAIQAFRRADPLASKLKRFTSDDAVGLSRFSFAKARDTFAGREEIIADLVGGFLASPHQGGDFQYCYLIGDSGMGKSRLALELIGRIQDRWPLAGFAEEDAIEYILSTHWTPTFPTFLVVDDAVARITMLRKLVDDLQSRSKSFTTSARLLLLARDVDGRSMDEATTWFSDAPGSVLRICLQGLSASDAVAIMRGRIERADCKEKSFSNEQLDNFLVSIDPQRRPLWAAIAGELVVLSGGDDRTLTPKKRALRQILENERSFWRERAKGYSRGEEWVRQHEALLVLATMTRGLSPKNLESVWSRKDDPAASLLPGRNTFNQQFYDIISDHQGGGLDFAPLSPDLLGEGFVDLIFSEARQWEAPLRELAWRIEPWRIALFAALFELDYGSPQANPLRFLPSPPPQDGSARLATTHALQNIARIRVYQLFNADPASKPDWLDSPSTVELTKETVKSFDAFASLSQVFEAESQSAPTGEGIA